MENGGLDKAVNEWHKALRERKNMNILVYKTFTINVQQKTTQQSSPSVAR